MKSLLKSSNTLTAYVIGVLIVWAVIISVGYFFKGSTVGRPILLVCGGFLLGMLSMRHVAARALGRKHFLCLAGTVVASILKLRKFRSTEPQDVQLT
jgi:hypothetical protein